jgi:hypothetical protein
VLDNSKQVHDHSVIEVLQRVHVEPYHDVVQKHCVPRTHCNVACPDMEHYPALTVISLALEVCKKL